jgi:hypothetical protein
MSLTFLAKTIFSKSGLSAKFTPPFPRIPGPTAVCDLLGDSPADPNGGTAVTSAALTDEYAFTSRMKF